MCAAHSIKGNGYTLNLNRSGMKIVVSLLSGVGASLKGKNLLPPSGANSDLQTSPFSNNRESISCLLKLSPFANPW